jgi:hypothetical protein
MSKPQQIRATVVDVKPLSQDDQDLLAEIKALRIDSLKNLTAAFQQLITLSTTISGLQIAIHKLPENPTFDTWGVEKILTSISLVCLFSAVFMSFIGQSSSRIELATLDLLASYGQRRDQLIKRRYQSYSVASKLFLIGLAVFIMSFVVNFV